MQSLTNPQFLQSYGWHGVPYFIHLCEMGISFWFENVDSGETVIIKMHTYSIPHYRKSFVQMTFEMLRYKNEELLR